VAADSELLVAPGSLRVKVRGVQVHGERQPVAVAGQRTAINLAGVEVDDIVRGQALVTPGAFVESRTADATLELLPGARTLKHGARVRFHQGTAEILGRVALIGPARGEAVDGRGPSADAVSPGSQVPALAAGEHAFVRLRLEAPAVLARGDRYILR